MEWARRQPRSLAAVSGRWCGGRSAFPGGLVSPGVASSPWAAVAAAVCASAGKREVGVAGVDMKLRLPSEPKAH